MTIADGTLRIHVLNWGEVAWASVDRAYGDFRLTVEATQISGPIDNEYGVLVRMNGDEQFYAFSISGDGYVRVARFDDGHRGTFSGRIGSPVTPSTRVRRPTCWKSKLWARS